jgi:hypothetical protein
MDYLNKYLKYKKKYLDLKGGKINYDGVWSNLSKIDNIGDNNYKITGTFNGHAVKDTENIEYKNYNGVWIFDKINDKIVNNLNNGIYDNKIITSNIFSSGLLENNKKNNNNLKYNIKKLIKTKDNNNNLKSSFFYKDNIQNINKYEWLGDKDWVCNENKCKYNGEININKSYIPFLEYYDYIYISGHIDKNSNILKTINHFKSIDGDSGYIPDIHISLLTIFFKKDSELYKNYISVIDDIKTNILQIYNNIFNFEYYVAEKIDIIGYNFLAIIFKNDKSNDTHLRFVEEIIKIICKNNKFYKERVFINTKYYYYYFKSEEKKELLFAIKEDDLDKWCPHVSFKKTKLNENITYKQHYFEKIISTDKYLLHMDTVANHNGDIRYIYTI